MFTRSLFQTADMVAQHVLLTEVARLIDAGTLRTTLGEHFGAINAGNLRRAHSLIESGAPAARSCSKGSDRPRPGPDPSGGNGGVRIASGLASSRT